MFFSNRIVISRLPLHGKVLLNITLIGFDVYSAKPEDATKNGSEQNEEDQVKKGGKKTAKKKDESESTSQASETKESPMVNGNKPTEDKESEASQAPVKLTKEEEEELAQQRREERKRKDQEFLNQLAKALARSAIQPLGRDRVFRRYWAFRSLRGLFVEDDDPDQHLLLEPESESESEVSCGDQQCISPCSVKTL